MGVINQNSGTFNWFEQAPSAKLRKKIGAILETPNFYLYLSAYKNLEVVADIKNIPNVNIDSVLKTVNLFERKNDPVSTYSLGMKQRLALASALLGDPEVLVLDEPTNGLDPQGIADIREIIKKIANEGKTIIIASHILDEIEKICNHVAVIKNGVLITAGHIKEVLSKNDIMELSSNDLDKLESAIRDFPGIKDIIKEKDKIKLSVDENVKPENINKFLYEKGIILSHLYVSKKSLESIFLELVAEK